MKLLVIIPAYNEEACLADTVRGLTEVCPDVDYLVINDGSRDDTPKICDDLHLSHVDLPVNTGLASGVRCGMKYAYRHGYDAAVQFDADGQHLPQAIAPMAQAMRDQQADIVIASRGLAGSGAKGARGIGAKLITWLIAQGRQGRRGPRPDARPSGRRVLPQLVELRLVHGAHVHLASALPVVQIGR